VGRGEAEFAEAVFAVLSAASPTPSIGTEPLIGSAVPELKAPD
jgi:hypothetical protein